MSIVVTGATGFLGLHLIRELLNQHPELTLLTRADSTPALPRIQRFLEHCGASPEEVCQLPQRLHVVAGDVTAPHLGLADNDFRRLADDIDVLWHCAADIAFASPDPAVYTRNVSGTRHILELLTNGERQPLLCHASTIAVAGARRNGIIPEAPLDATAGFNTPYEESKYQAEILVRHWCTRQGRNAAIFRLAGLITNTPPYPGRPQHPLETAAQAFRDVLRTFADLVPPDGHLRLTGINPEAVINLVPVEHAAHAMAQAVERIPLHGPRHLHIVHRHGTPAATILQALSTALDNHLVFHLDPAPPSTDAERIVHEIFGGYLAQLTTKRHYDDTTMTGLGLACTTGTVQNENYLVASIA
ncbi:MAG: SDR family oxidoreductase [Pseudonocardiaceae bacterium]